MSGVIFKGLEKLHNDSGCSQIEYFPAFIPGSGNVWSAGIWDLVQYKLYNRLKPVVFYSFHKKDAFGEIDIFKVLDLPGTEFIHLPITGHELHERLKKYCNLPPEMNEAQWNDFSESACEYFLECIFRKLSHGQELDIINQTLAPLRMGFTAILSAPHLRNSFQSAIEGNIEAFRSYVARPQISQMMHLSGICRNPIKTNLTAYSDFTKLLKTISSFRSNTDAVRAISTIDTLNKLTKTIKDGIYGKEHPEHFILR